MNIVATIRALLALVGLLTVSTYVRAGEAPQFTCAASESIWSRYLAGQGGFWNTRSPTSVTFGECSHVESGLFANFTVLKSLNVTKKEPWESEVDFAIGKRGALGAFDYTAMVQWYRVDLGSKFHLVNILNGNTSLGWTTALNERTKLRLYAVADIMSPQSGLAGGVATSFALGSTLTFQLSERWSTSTTVEAWKFVSHGFLQNTNWNIKAIQGVKFQINDDWSLNVSAMLMHGNITDRLDHSTKGVVKVGFTAKF
ncbi:MAG: hypothetical protein JWO50_632 [Candidatus Kaiserbacteria bacterium]|nr:hypothetical protein [Candidatus Kaiserbacteria bacterium]